MLNKTEGIKRASNLALTVGGGVFFYCAWRFSSLWGLVGVGEIIDARLRYLAQTGLIGLAVGVGVWWLLRGLIKSADKPVYSKKKEL